MDILINFLSKMFRKGTEMSSKIIQILGAGSNLVSSKKIINFFRFNPYFCSVKVKNYATKFFLLNLSNTFMN